MDHAPRTARLKVHMKGGARWGRGLERLDVDEVQASMVHEESEQLALGQVEELALVRLEVDAVLLSGAKGGWN